MDQTTFFFIHLHITRQIMTSLPLIYLGSSELYQLSVGRLLLSANLGRAYVPAHISYTSAPSAAQMGISIA